MDNFITRDVHMYTKQIVFQLDIPVKSFSNDNDTPTSIVILMRFLYFIGVRDKLATILTTTVSHKHSQKV